jgi:branched-chain amino acid transport system substrate-binding protein
LPRPAYFAILSIHFLPGQKLCAQFNGWNDMELRNWKRYVALALGLFFLTAGSGAAKSGRTAAAPQPPAQAAFIDLENGLRSYSSGDLAAAAAFFDRVLAASQPADSQLAFIGLYYGIRCRLGSGRTAEADSLFESLKLRVPAGQLPELELVLGRSAQPAETATAGFQPEADCNKLGVILPLSGKYVDFGQAIAEGIKLAVEQYNRTAGEEGRVFLEVLDDQSNPIQAATLGRRCAMDSSTAALIGSYENEPSLSLGLVAANNGIPLVCPFADDPGLDHLGPLVHVINRTDPTETDRLAGFAVRGLGLQTIAILAPEDEKGKLLADNFGRAVRKNGGVVLSDQRYAALTSTFENQMDLLRRYLPDAIYLPANFNEITQLTSQVHYFGLGAARLLGTELWDNERVIRMGGEYVEGAVFASPFYNEGEGLQWKAFKELYESTYRRPVNRYSALGYDSARLILDAAGKMPIGRKALAEKLNRVQDCRGAHGIYSVEPNGLVTRKVFILEISGGSVGPARVDEPAGEARPPAAPDSSSAAPQPARQDP